jgi:hypothetical protein
MVKQQAVSLVRIGNVAAAPGKKVERLVTLHDKYLEMDAAYRSAKDTPQFKRDLTAWTQATQGKDPFVALENPDDPITEPAMMAHAFQLVAIAGASGAASVNYPKCSTVK